MKYSSKYLDDWALARKEESLERPRKGQKTGQQGSSWLTFPGVQIREGYLGELRYGVQSIRPSQETN